MHGKHEAWPSSFWYVPLSQDAHDLASVPALRKRPTSQDLQGCPTSLLYIPASHDKHLLLPASEDDPAAQSKHVIELEFSLYVSGSHCLHEELPG